MDSANEVIADAKTRVVSVSASVSDIVNSVGHYIFTKSLNENGQHSENDKKLIEQKNILIKKNRQLFRVQVSQSHSLQDLN